MKKLCLFLALMATLLGLGCQARPADTFALYLLAGDIAATEAQGLNLEALELERKPLITSADLLSYDWQTHTLELTSNAYAQIQQIFPTPVQVNGIPFVTCVGDERIYMGGFWTPASSLSFDGVVIMQPLDPAGTRIQISWGYPGSAVFSDADPRADERILSALEQAGKLAANP